MTASAAELLSAHRVVLASQSPRRLELLRDLGLVFEVIPSTFAEDLNKDDFASPAEYVVENARLKALEVVSRITRRADNDAETGSYLVIGCDTVVVHQDKILEKPCDPQDAKETLARLSAGTHDVYSGVALCTAAHPPHVFVEKTTVTFGSLGAAQIQAYVDSGEPMDKAGSYGIQGAARSFVRELHGCYNNVIGFPTQRFCEELRELHARGQL